MSVPEDVISIENFTRKLEDAKKKLVVVHFWAPWADQCKQMNDVMCVLAEKFPKVVFLKVEAEEVPEISEKYEIEAVPTFIFIKRNQKLDRLDGAHAPELEKLIKKNEDALPPAASPEEDAKMALNARIKALINSAPCLLFMKGSPDTPKCGFSKQMIELLNKHNGKYSTFDILEHPDIRQGLKEYSNWPTYPQLYINGELIGGLDIIREMDEEGELESTLPKQQSLDDRLKALINKGKIMLFMKGSPDTPRCGFSKQMIGILNETDIKFDHFDILTDDEVRQGIKKFSNWPTFPQLYVNGELIGGLDIIKEMKEEGELLEALNS